MPELLSEKVRATTLKMTRVMFPHDDLPDEAYDKVVRQLEADAHGDESVLATIELGVTQLDDPRPFLELGRRAARDSQAIRGGRVPVLQARARHRGRRALR